MFASLSLGTWEVVLLHDMHPSWDRPPNGGSFEADMEITCLAPSPSTKQRQLTVLANGCALRLATGSFAGPHLHEAAEIGRDHCRRVRRRRLGSVRAYGANVGSGSNSPSPSGHQADTTPICVENRVVVSNEGLAEDQHGWVHRWTHLSPMLFPYGSDAQLTRHAAVLDNVILR